MEKVRGENSLYNILNMDNMLAGGMKTEYGVYALSALVKGHKGCYADGALEVLDDLSKINFRELNEKQANRQQNEKYIIDAMYGVADEILQWAIQEKNGGLRESEAEPIADDVYKIMRIAETNNKGNVDFRGERRQQFMARYTSHFDTNTAKLAASKEALRDKVSASYQDKEAAFLETTGMSLEGKYKDRHKREYLSGVVVADRIADDVRSGAISEPVTPEKGKELSEGVKRKYVSDNKNKIVKYLRDHRSKLRDR